MTPASTEKVIFNQINKKHKQSKTESPKGNPTGRITRKQNDVYQFLLLLFVLMKPCILCAVGLMNQEHVSSRLQMFKPKPLKHPTEAAPQSTPNPRRFTCCPPKCVRHIYKWKLSFSTLQSAHSFLGLVFPYESWQGFWAVSSWNILMIFTHIGKCLNREYYIILYIYNNI